MEFLLLGSLFFTIALVCGFIGGPPIIQMLNRYCIYRVSDRKRTIYGEEAEEFNALKTKEEDLACKTCVPRLGGLIFFPAIFITLLLSILFSVPIAFVVIMLILLAISVFTLYDDFIDIGKVHGKPIGFVRRLITLFCILLAGGVILQTSASTTITFLPVAMLTGIDVGIFFGLFFALWCIFWQASSIIDGIDGLSGSIYLTLFIATGVISLLQGQIEPYLLSSLAIGMLIPFLYFNYPPAKLYLTEVGISVLTFLFASTTFFLALGPKGGVGIWMGFILGVVLIGTWVSNIVQLAYRKKTGKKLFRIAPIHHHFQAYGWSDKKVVSVYTSVTVFLAIFGLLISFIL